MKISFLLMMILTLLIFTIKDVDYDYTRLNPPSVSGEVKEILPHIIDFRDTIPNDTLWEYRNAEKMPLMYSRKIFTGVCIDGECRMVNIELFWNITGSYLGFKLPKGGYLSKLKHIPFSANDYDRLHILLSDPLSALANYSINELAPNKDSTKTNGKRIRK